MKNKSLIIIAAALVVILGAAVLVYPSLSQKASEELTTKAADEQTTNAYPQYADITIYDNEGIAIQLSDLIGKPVIINFWATWCGYCLYEMPFFEEAYKLYGEDVQFLIVNTDDGIAKGEQYISSQGFTFPTYYDLDRSAYITYGLYSGIPRTLAIDAEGNMVYNRAGMLDSTRLQGIIDMVK